MIRLNKFEKINGIHANIYAKLEKYNPFGSIKDRAAIKIINSAEMHHQISKNSCIIEATSGNMGIALAGICQIKNYACKIVMPENMSDMRKKLIRSLGAELILTPSEFSMSGAIHEVKKIITKSSNVYYTNQFNNFSSVEAHIETTATEIYQELHGKIDVIISGIGTGATITGISKFLKNRNNSTEIIGVLPSNNPHKIQGIGAGFAPPLLNYSLIDKIIKVYDEEAFYEKNKIYETEGLGVGISSGAVIAALKKLLKTNNYIDKNIVMIFADGDDRY